MSKFNEEKLKEIFTSANKNEPFYKAVMQLVNEHIDDNTMAAIVPNLASEDRAYNCGRVAALKFLVSEIESLDAKNNLTKEDQDPSSEQGLS